MEIKKPLKYAFHVIVRPFDGFWDLKHEKRGSLLAAILIMAMFLLTEALTYKFSGFVVMIVHWEYFNLLRALFSTLVPILLWCVSNWCFTTLMDGKGSLKDIFIATSYAFTPSILINLPLIVISNVITQDESAFYYFFKEVANLWVVFLILVGIMETHDYSFSKAIFSSILTIIGIGAIIFLFFIFFSLISDSLAYFIALYKEVVFRFY